MRRKIKVIGLPALIIGIIMVGSWQFGPRLVEQRGLDLTKSAYQVRTEERLASLPIQYVESHVCRQCHQGQHDEWQEAKHRTVNCEACHGPARAHIDGKARLSIDTSSEACGICHYELTARPGGFPQVSLAQHNPGSACITCHNPMGAARQIPHFVAENTSCLSCHELQGLRPFPQSHVGRAAEVCLACHGRKGA